jgi:hypothetical protein
MKRHVAFFAIIIAGLVVSCKNDGGIEIPTEIIYPIEAPLYAVGSDSIASDLNVGIVTAWVNEHQLKTTGTIENGILRIGLTAVPDAWLMTADEAAAQDELPDDVKDFPKANTTITPKNTRMGGLTLRFIVDNDEYQILIQDAETSYAVVYANQNAIMAGKTENIKFEIEDSEVIMSYDVDIHFSPEWNILSEVSSVAYDDDTMTMSITERLVTKLPESARYYYWYW